MAGRGLTETELIGYNFGTRNVPVIFASGDDRLQQTLADAMPWVEYVVVKRVTSPTRVAALPSGSAGRELQAGARRALERLAAGKTRPMTLAAPIRAGLIATYPAFLPPALGNIPGIERRGDTVLFSAPDLTSAWRGVGALVVLASRNFSGLTTELMRGNPEWSGAVKAAGDSVWARAGAFERGEWKP
jgi:D-aminopeptidase